MSEGAPGPEPVGETAGTQTDVADKVPGTVPTSDGFTIITGLSGAGRSETARCLEDLGYFVVDNLPPALINKMAELVAMPGGPRRVAIVVDARGGNFFRDLREILSELRSQKVPYRILFLEAADEDLVNRFEATRRRHPLGSSEGMLAGIRKEREMLESLRGDADIIIDTTDMSARELRDRVKELFSDAPPEASLQVSLVSFGYKYGLPRDADLVIDVRFLPNPYWVQNLRALPGTDEQVRGFVKGQQAYKDFMKRIRPLLEFLVPGYVAEGKTFLNIAFGCTGGRHRSVVVADELARFLRGQNLPVTIDHRDLERHPA
jgi:UPF0042 nucleotide-binding protein